MCAFFEIFFKVIRLVLLLFTKSIHKKLFFKWDFALLIYYKKGSIYSGQQLPFLIVLIFPKNQHNTIVGTTHLQIKDGGLILFFKLARYFLFQNFWKQFVTQWVFFLHQHKIEMYPFFYCAHFYPTNNSYYKKLTQAISDFGTK